MRDLRVVVPISTAAALLFIDFEIAANMVRFGVLGSATTLELVVFGLQVAKTVSAFLVKRLRRAGPGVLVDIYGAELMALPLLGAAYLFANDSGALALGTQILDGWMVGAALAGLPFVAYRIAAAMHRGGELKFVVPAGIMAGGLGGVLASAEVSGVGPQTGMAGLAKAALVGHGTSALSPQLFGALAVIYASLLLYSVLGSAEGPKVAIRPGLLVGAAATFACAGAIVAFGDIALAPRFALLVPAVVIVGAGWWIGRAK